MQLMKSQPTASNLKFILSLCGTLLLTHCSLVGSSGLKHAKNISYTVPTGWMETESEGESDKAFKLSSGSTVTLTSSCQSQRQATLESLTKDLLLGARKIRFIKQENFNIANSPALFSHVNATVEGQAFQLLFVVTRKNGCIFDFSLLSPKSIPQKEIAEFIDFAKSFNYEQN